MNGIIIGYDPGGSGGNGSNGLAILTVDNGGPHTIELNTFTNSELVIRNIIETQENIIGLGVDTLSCWCTRDAGWRPADIWLRNHYPDVINSVMTPNNLAGAMAINGMSVLIEIRKQFSDIKISETHPKVLYYALTENRYDFNNDPTEMNQFLSDKLGIDIHTNNDHEWDAAISAYALLMGITGKWELDLHQLPLQQNERLIKPCGETHYYWPGDNF